jgi:uncharacterized protein YqeY
MNLLERITADIKDAMRNKDATRLDTLRMVKSDLNYLMIEKKSEIPSDADVLAVIQKAVKKRRDAIEGFEKGGRAELAAKEKAELAILAAYLPQQLSRAELEQIVKAVIAEIGATSKADMGRVMKAVMPKVSGRADGKLVSEVVASWLA